MNRTIKEATMRTYHYENHSQLREHLTAFINAYNFAKRLKTLSGLTPYQYICLCFQIEPHRFINNPNHHFGTRALLDNNVAVDLRAPRLLGCAGREAAVETHCPNGRFCSAPFAAAKQRL